MHEDPALAAEDLIAQSGGLARAKAWTAEVMAALKRRPR